ncbi:little elongation complex subunit 2 [Aplochiton taeniatus]
MMYLQDVAKMCAEDYNYISQGAMRYSEEYFMACLERMQNYPQLYLLHEMTSLTGGVFSPGLSLTFEKQLLTVGNVEITNHKILPDDAQLASDYERVSSAKPPAKKAKDTHAAISSDSNAERLCARYQPHVCLTREALLKLLDNQGPEFSEPWELPVWVKTDPGTDGGQRKTVYIDSPLLKAQMTLRERSHLFHQESLQLSVKKEGHKEISHLVTESPVDHLPDESTQRSYSTFEASVLDFEVDLSDLETFGGSSYSSAKPSKKPKTEDKPSAALKSRPPGKSGPKARSTESSGALVSASRTGAPKEEGGEDSSWADAEDAVLAAPAEPSAFGKPRAPSPPRARRPGQESSQESQDEAASLGDSEEERLVIDDGPAAARTKTPTGGRSDAPMETSSGALADASSSPSPRRTTGPGKTARRAKVAGDQLGQILRMQSAMLKPAQDSAKPSTLPGEQPLSALPTRAPPGQGHPQSLVKPCVSSFLECHENQDGVTYTKANKPINPEQKRLLSQDLLLNEEEAQNYEAPEEGNLLYKLYSLQEVLLLVRSTVSLSHSRRAGGGGVNKHVPVHVLPKLEYQLCHGVERLTRSEACQLWAETLLHSATVSYVGHIDAHTSKMALLRRLPADWKSNLHCGFVPSKSLNILHHLLKKISGLEDGHYLIAHKPAEPFVMLLKEKDNPKASRGAYDLRQVHSGPPQPPAAGPPPWVPVDPSVVLPFHKQHGRAPCTFPPKDLLTSGVGGPAASKKGPPPQPNSQPGKKKQKKKKNKGIGRTQRRKEWLEKRLQQGCQKN